MEGASSGSLISLPQNCERSALSFFVTLGSRLLLAGRRYILRFGCDARRPLHDIVTFRSKDEIKRSGCGVRRTCIYYKGAAPAASFSFPQLWPVTTCRPRRSAHIQWRGRFRPSAAIADVQPARAKRRQVVHRGDAILRWRPCTSISISRGRRTRPSGLTLVLFMFS